jgi:hypothetical protein
MPKFRCIYCLDEKDIAEFDTEHVVPVAFGGFKNAPVLKNQVCVACNSYFGKYLDIALARRAGEGLQRYLSGVRRPEDLEKFRYDLVRLSADAEGDYKGAMLNFVPDPAAPQGVRLTPAPQVGFALADSTGFKYYRLDEVEAGLWQSDRSVDWTRGIKIIATDPDPIRATLAAQGVTMRKWRTMEPPESQAGMIDVIEEWRWTPVQQRALAKIAFNYLAYVHGARFVLRAEFDSTRRFIRRGVEPFLPCVQVRKHDIYTVPGAPSPNEKAVVHILTLTKPLNAEVVLGQVTLFNWVSYDVVLAYDWVPGVRQVGLVFNVATRGIYQLAKKPRRRKQGRRRNA